MALGRLVEIAREADFQLVECMPPEVLRSEVPFLCQFGIGSIEDGRRIVAPKFPIQDDKTAIQFIKVVFVAGSAIRAHREGFSSPKRGEWRIMTWLFEWARLAPEHAMDLHRIVFEALYAVYTWISEYDGQHRFDAVLQNRIKQEYVYAAVARQQRALGRTVERRMLASGDLEVLIGGYR